MSDVSGVSDWTEVFALKMGDIAGVGVVVVDTDREAVEFDQMWLFRDLRASTKSTPGIDERRSASRVRRC